MNLNNYVSIPWSTSVPRTIASWVGFRPRGVTAVAPVPPSLLLHVRVRRAVTNALLHNSSTFHSSWAPMQGWDELSLQAISDRLRSLDLDTLLPLHTYEGTRQNRAEVLAAIDTRIALLHGE